MMIVWARSPEVRPQKLLPVPSKGIDAQSSAERPTAIDPNRQGIDVAVFSTHEAEHDSLLVDNDADLRTAPTDTAEWRLRRDQRRIDRQYRRLLGQVVGDKEFEALESQLMADSQIIAEERGEIRMKRLRRMARKYHTVVIPKRTAWGDRREDDNWERKTMYWCLKPDAEATVWLQVEEAKKRRRETWLAWVPFVAGLRRSGERRSRDR